MHVWQMMYFFHTLINKLFSEEIKIPEHCLKLEGWQGLPHINTVKLYKLSSPLKSVYLFSLFSHEIKERLIIQFV